jgi:diacylglycerol kinase family enzyme
MSSPEHSPSNGRPPVSSKNKGRASRRAQVAAVGALVILLSLVWLTVSLIANDPVGLVLSFVSVFLVVFFVWFILTRRGARRWLVVPIIWIALLALGTYGYDQKYQLAVMFVLLLLFGIVARYAVRHDQAPTRRATHGNARPLQPMQCGVLIINPKSGGGKAERFNLPDEARRRGIEPLLLRPGDDLCELAEGAVGRGADVIGMAGGDGSQALVAAVAMRHAVAHVCVPAGTRNHFALDLGLDRNDVVGALDAFTDGVERRVDLASLNDRIFVNNASLGVYARVVQSEKYRDAKLTTWKQMLPDMMGQETAGCALRFETPHTQDWCDASLVIVSNNPYQMRRFRGAGTRPDLDTGQLGIFVAELRGAAGVAKLVTLGTIGAHRRFGGVLQWSSLEFEVHSETPVAVGLDGEALMLTPPLRFASLPGALLLRVPRHASGVSPAGAAVTVTRRNLQQLVRIAAGRPAEAHGHETPVDGGS